MFRLWHWQLDTTRLDVINTSLCQISSTSLDQISSTNSARSHPSLSQISSTLGQTSSTLGQVLSTLGQISFTLGQMSSTLGQISSVTRLDLIQNRGKLFGLDIEKEQPHRKCQHFCDGLLVIYVMDPRFKISSFRLNRKGPCEIFDAQRGEKKLS